MEKTTMPTKLNEKIQMWKKKQLHGRRYLEINQDYLRFIANDQELSRQLKLTQGENVSYYRHIANSNFENY